ncbi:MAG: hypothetical protein AB7U35_05460 [Sphingobium sp.]
MIRSLIASGAMALALIATPAAAAPTAADKGEAELAKMLEGRVAGKPQSCITAWSGSDLRVIDKTALVYDAGSTIYVARPADPRSLDSNDILVIKRTGGQLCKQDIVQTIDRSSGFMTGVVFLGDFVPYKKN